LDCHTFPEMKLRLHSVTPAKRKLSRSRSHFFAAPLLLALIFCSANFAVAQTVDFGGGGGGINPDGVNYQGDQAGNKNKPNKPKPSPTPADPTWTGGGPGVLWSTANNWGGTAPTSSNATAVVFAGTTNTGTAGTPLNQDIGTPMILNTITFDATAGNFFLGGNQIGFQTTGSSDSITQSSNNNQSIANAIENGNTTTGNTATITLTGTGTGIVTLSGVISDNASHGAAAITKTQSSTFVLSGANTYSGGTTIDGGTLLVNNTAGSGTGTGSVTVNNSGTVLGGTGTISGLVTVNGPATITAATNGTTGALTLSGGLTLAGTSGNLATYLVDLTASTSDKLVITGNLNLSTLFDKISFQGTTGASSYILATFTGTRSGTFDTVTNLPSGYHLVYGANDIELDVVPEPGTWIGGALALAALVATQRRQLMRLLKRTA
jgi:autotransporter-associated beta strand protein